MCRFKPLQLLVIILALYSLPCFAADIAKIGVVDYQRVMKESDAGKEVVNVLRAKQKERKNQLETKKKEIEALQKKIESIELIDKKEEREQLQSELAETLNSFKTLENSFNQAFKEINIKSSDRIKKDVNELVVQMGKKGGYVLIVEKADVIYYPDSVDITSKVIQEYNKTYKGR